MNNSGFHHAVPQLPNSGIALFLHPGYDRLRGTITQRSGPALDRLPGNEPSMYTAPFRVANQHDYRQTRLQKGLLGVAEVRSVTV